MKRFVFFAAAVLLLLLMVGLLAGVQAEEQSDHQHTYRVWSIDYMYNRHTLYCDECGVSVIEDCRFMVCRPYMIEQNGQYTAAGYHVFYCEVCDNHTDVMACKAETGETQTLSGGADEYLCKDCGEYFEMPGNPCDEHKNVYYKHVWMKTEEGYISADMHGKRCLNCDALEMENCYSFQEHPQKLDDSIHAYKCELCQEYFRRQEHQGDIVPEGAEEHFAVCWDCGFEYLREQHAFDWIPYEDTTNTMHYAVCPKCEYKMDPMLHEDADGDNECDICRGFVPFCLECGNEGYGVKYEVRQINGKNVHAFLCEHDRVLLTHEADLNYVVSVGKEGHVVQCGIEDCSIQSEVQQHIGQTGYRKYYGGTADKHYYCCDICLCFPEITPLEEHVFDDTYEMRENVHYRVCSLCYSESGEDPEAHAFDSLAAADSFSHVQCCSKCGYMNYSTYKDHNFIEVKDLGNGTHSAVCGECGYSSITSHYGKNKTKPIGDRYYHETQVECEECGAAYTGLGLHSRFNCGWNRCTDCGQKDAVFSGFYAGHDFSVFTDLGETHAYICTVCGEKAFEEYHTYGCMGSACWECGVTGNQGVMYHEYELEQVNAEEGHFLKCWACGETEFAGEHKLSCAGGSVCAECGYLPVPENAGIMHTPGETGYDENVNFSICAYCGEKFDEKAHTYPCEFYQVNGSGVCECGMTRPENARVAHEVTALYEYDEIGHWGCCNRCRFLDAGEHLMENGKCAVCGFEG